jgi:coenzyme F420 hydrogenase subunit beta
MIKNEQLNTKFFKYACTNCGSCKEVYPYNFARNNGFFYLKKRLKIKELNQFNKFCPGVGFSYIEEKKYNFSNLIGNYFKSYTGFSNNKLLRKNAASGGIITEILIYLINTKKVDYILMPIQGKDFNVLPKYKLTKDIKEISNNSQSIYTKIPIENLNIEKKKKIAFVGLPDQVKSLRILINNKLIKNNIKFFIGPMVGINMDSDSINGIRLSYNINKNSKIQKLKWREGKWPGFLGIKFKGYPKIKLKKFYYNFLLPFYCSHESLLSVDFSNEEADISVGDAWSPKFENSKLGGISLIWSKNLKGDNILKILSTSNKISLKEVSYKEAIKMHEHMLDFKKRGSQYRKKIYKIFNLPTPNHNIKKINYKLSRYLIESIILFLIFFLKTSVGKFILLITPPKILGYLFQKLRHFWKIFTKNLKRKDLEVY